MVGEFDKDESRRLELESDEGEEERSLVPLDDRVVEVVKASEKHTIRPASLASALGISIDEATMELCGLLRAVGTTASFQIDENHGETFVFPHDFEKRARAHRQGRQAEATVAALLRVSWKILQIVVAFGLLLSLLTVGVAVIAVFLLSSSRQQQNHNPFLRFLRQSLVTLQQVLWIYSLHHSDGSIPLLSDSLRAMRLGIAICCTRNPLRTIHLWVQAHRLAQRRRFVNRGWSTHDASSGTNDRHYLGDSLPLAASNHSQSTPQQQRGLLSMVVEFLFGPLPQTEQTDDLWKWKLREYIIVSNHFHLSLAQLRPFIDNPHTNTQIPQTLHIVHHFHGKPNTATSPQQKDNIYQTHFTFSELQTEYNPTNHVAKNNYAKWQHHWFPSTNFFTLYLNDSVTPVTTTYNNNNNNYNNLPTFLVDKYHALTQLSLKEFQLCSILGVINFIGVSWFRYTVILPKNTLPLRWFMDPLSYVLALYSYIYIALPIARLVIITFLNLRVRYQNQLRQQYAANNK